MLIELAISQVNSPTTVYDSTLFELFLLARSQWSGVIRNLETLELGLSLFTYLIFTMHLAANFLFKTVHHISIPGPFISSVWLFFINHRD